MKPDLGNPFGPMWDGAPPHMAPLDLPLWRRFRAKRYASWILVYYDVALGDAAPLPTAGARQDLDMWQRLTRPRADAIVLSPQGWTIIELRPDAGPSAIGSLLSYLLLWRADPPDTKPVMPLLVTDAIRPDAAAFAKEYGIPVELV